MNNPMKSERQKFDEFVDWVEAVIKSPPLPDEPETISELRENIMKELKNAGELFVLFGMMDNSVCYSIQKATDEMRAYHEKLQLEAAGHKPTLN